VLKLLRTAIQARVQMRCLMNSQKLLGIAIQVSQASVQVSVGLMILRKLLGIAIQVSQASVQVSVLLMNLRKLQAAQLAVGSAQPSSPMFAAPQASSCACAAWSDDNWYCIQRRRGLATGTGRI